MIEFFRDVLDGPLYIVATILSIIFIMAIIGFIMERKKLEKEAKSKIAVVSTEEVTPITPVTVEEVNVTDPLAAEISPVAEVENPVSLTTETDVEAKVNTEANDEANDEANGEANDEAEIQESAQLETNELAKIETEDVEIKMENEIEIEEIPVPEEVVTVPKEPVSISNFVPVEENTSEEVTEPVVVFDEQDQKTE